MNDKEMQSEVVVGSTAWLGWISSADRLPENPPNFPKDDHAACLCVWKYEMRILQWNAYYKVWDDSEGDDFFCNPQEVTHWMPLPPWPNAKFRGDQP